MIKSNTPSHNAPYAGLRVLDLGQGVASPYCGELLASYGADVIKVEPPEGDWARRLGTTYGRHSALSAVYNRGKRGLCLDLKNAKGLEIAKRLAGKSDVFIEGFRPGVAARLGLGYETLSRENPGLIYLSISGFGQTGPYNQRPCTDSVAQAFSGLVSVNLGNDKVPHRVGTTVSDISTGVYAFQAVQAALFARATVGTGRWIDVSLTQSTAALVGHKLAEYMLEGGTPRALNVPAGSYRTSNGWLMVTLVSEPQYQRLCRVLGREDLAQDPRYNDFAKRSDAADQLIAEVAQAFLQDTTEAWLRRLQAADIIADRILSNGDWLQDTHVKAIGAAIATDTPGMGIVHVARTPGLTGEHEDGLTAAPDVGQHSRAVLLENGYDERTVDQLVSSGAVREAAS
ncbi:CaiB/BaiF CoA transferase family protein [Bradyrhizobium canariense]|uniref:Crotonobetainyl-CoA:carnitine CoA-transferase CaiB n=1 Tax=Bradyrhizobium canariense TaxID=255045 RepID=A0A1H1RZM8_9BRAD|nr:CoA transferase [Bradyrhizobium canariense]SDS41221.1 Crotonobetainyl-CoA:carnitine CoA-transferase CaiB [Bradyrhizobium canariense]